MDWSLTSPRVLITNSLVGCAGMALVSVGAAVWTTDTRAQVLAMTFQHGAGAILQGAAPDAAPDEDSAVPAEVAIDIPARLAASRSITRPRKHPVPSSSIPQTHIFITCSAAIRPSGTASASAATALLVGHQDNRAQVGMAELAAARGYAAAATLSSTLYGWRPRQSAWCARDVSERVRVPHSRHQQAVQYRQACVERLHPLAERRRNRPLRPYPYRHQGRRAANGSSRRARGLGVETCRAKAGANLRTEPSLNRSARRLEGDISGESHDREDPCHCRGCGLRRSDCNAHSRACSRRCSRTVVNRSVGRTGISDRNKSVVAAAVRIAESRNAACTQGWPYYESACLRDNRRSDGKARAVRLVSADRSVSGRTLQAPR